jgi:hypothetical protein
MALILDGLLGETFPSWTTATRPASPAPGQVGFNSTLNSLEAYNGTSWVVGGLPAPSTSGNVLTSDGTNWVSSTGPVGVGQTWQNVTASRVSGTTYTNSTGKPIVVNVLSDQGSGGSATLTATISGVSFIIATESNSSGGTRSAGNVIVPNNATYMIVASGTGVSGIASWHELR